MRRLAGSLLLLAIALSLIGSDGGASAQKLCLDASQPQVPKDQLQICKQYNNESCCDNARSVEIAKTLAKYSDAIATIPNGQRCISALERVLCAECDPYATQLYALDHTGRYTDVPYLCTALSNRDPAETQPFCSTVWDLCSSIPMPNNPFVATNDPRLISLYDVYLTKGEFCRHFVSPYNNPSDGPKVCYRGKPVDYPDPLGEVALPPVTDMCVEQIGLSTKNDKGVENSYYVAMTPHPDQSRRAFFLERAGRLFLYDLPAPGSTDTLPSDGGSPFLDISDLVAQGTEQGAVGVAFHPDYPRNGRFFVSYICDSTDPDCKPTVCGCNADVDCTTEKAQAANPDGRWGTGDVCRNVTVVAEFSACSDTLCTPVKISQQTRIEPKPVRYIIRLGQPFINNNGGQIRFGADGMLYVMLGDGGGEWDPLGLAQNPKSFHGKVLRLDTLNGISVPDDGKIASSGLLGAYGIPPDNPHATDWDWRGEVFALGFHDPWKCTFDLLRPSVMMCGDVGWTKWEEVNVVTSGGNYGWKWFEGREYANATEPRPVPELKEPSFQYVWTNTSSVVGGFYVRGYEDSCLYGRYVFSDSNNQFYVATENPPYSGYFPQGSQPLNVSCAANSPIQCPMQGPFRPNFGAVFAWGQDINATLYTLTQLGVFRLTQPSNCNRTCTQKLPPGPAPRIDPASDLSVLTKFGANTAPPPPAGGAGSGGAGSGTMPPSTANSSSSSTSSSTTSSSTTSSDSSSSSSSSSTSGSEAVHNTSYWLKLGGIILVVLLLIIGVCCFCLIRGYREGKKKDEAFLEFQMADMQQPLQGEGDEDAYYDEEGNYIGPEGEEDEVYDPDAVGEDDDGTGTYYNEDGDGGTVVDDGATEYSAYGHGGGYAESEVGSEYTGAGGGYQGGGVRGDAMSDVHSEYNARDDWTDGGSYNSRR